jgi:hypothetical protein
LILTRLAPETYPAVRQLFSAPASQVQALSILDGNTRGQVYADNPGTPRFALAWDELATLFIDGEGQHGTGAQEFAGALRAWIADSVVPLAQRLGIPDLTLIYDSPGWGAALSPLSARYRLGVALRHHYRLWLPEPEKQSRQEA